MMEILYIDPGGGSYLIQVIIAAILGVAFYFKTVWNWVKSFFVKKQSPKPEETNDSGV
jgi:hypothetical protein